jgi:methionine salvage enolase-phosphatase E1
VKKQLWGGEFWTDGYYVGTVGLHATEEVIKELSNKDKKKHMSNYMYSNSNCFSGSIPRPLAAG